MNQRGHIGKKNCPRAGTSKAVGYSAAGLAFLLAVGLSSCSGGGHGKASANEVVTVGVTKVVKKTLSRQITLSSELVPFQEIDVYAKESGYVQKLNVDYGTHVKTGQTMATLEIPELQAQLEQDEAEIKNAINQVSRADHELQRYNAQYNALHLEYTRLNQVSRLSPGSWRNRKLTMRKARILPPVLKSTLEKRRWKRLRASWLRLKRNSLTTRLYSTIPKSPRHSREL